MPKGGPHPPAAQEAAELQAQEKKAAQVRAKARVEQAWIREVAPNKRTVAQVGQGGGGTQ